MWGLAEPQLPHRRLRFSGLEQDPRICVFKENSRYFSSAGESGPVWCCGPQPWLVLEPMWSPRKYWCPPRLTTPHRPCKVAGAAPTSGLLKAQVILMCLDCRRGFTRSGQPEKAPRRRHVGKSPRILVVKTGVPYLGVFLGTFYMDLICFLCDPRRASPSLAPFDVLGTEGQG